MLFFFLQKLCLCTAKQLLPSLWGDPCLCLPGLAWAVPDLLGGISYFLCAKNCA